MSLQTPPKALLTDVFGTVVDWRTSVTKHLFENCQSTVPTLFANDLRSTASALTYEDWGRFAQQWRDGYFKFCRTHDPTTSNTHGFKTVDQFYRETLEELLRSWRIQGLWTSDQMDWVTSIWHKLEPWPDSAKGLSLLNQKFSTATLSNGNTSLLQDLASFGSLPYKQIISAENFKAYKPHPNVYNGAAKQLEVEPKDCALIAAHLNDLKAARGCGYQTIYIERPQEEAWDEDDIRKTKEEAWVDMWINDGQGGFEEIARRFGLS